MKVKELIEQLQKVDPERIVIMSSDSEGNSYSPLSDFWEGAYLADTTWSGEVGFEKLTLELKEEGYDEEDILEGEKCIVMCPVN